LEMGSWPFSAVLLISLLIDLNAYMYFTWRIWMFTRNKWIFVTMCALCATRTGMNIYMSLASVLQLTWHVYLNDLGNMNIGLIVIHFTGDAFSASAMAYYLAKYRIWLHDPPLRKAPPIEAVLNRLIVFAVATGALTSLMDVIIGILALSQPHSLAFFSCAFIQSHLYSNSVFASLNIRNAVLSNGPSTLGSDLPTGLSLRVADSSNIPMTVSEFSEPEMYRGEAGKGAIVEPVSYHCHDAV